ncbi:helix-turn-helix domain-containing protein [Streptomyces sp. NPDC051183]|uniref:helix-turn-helix domain-containing protein n=1 Tax=Streptomyces sp. NPDC051183 TaxID=3155165 RepID=UPI003431D509
MGVAVGGEVRRVDLDQGVHAVAVRLEEALHEVLLGPSLRVGPPGGHHQYACPGQALLVIEVGYAATSIGAVAARAGVGKDTVYRRGGGGASRSWSSRPCSRPPTMLRSRTPERWPGT